MTRPDVVSMYENKTKHRLDREEEKGSHVRGHRHHQDTQESPQRPH